MTLLLKNTKLTFIFDFRPSVGHIGIVGAQSGLFQKKITARRFPIWDSKGVVTPIDYPPESRQKREKHANLCEFLKIFEPFMSIYVKKCEFLIRIERFLYTDCHGLF